MSVEAKLSRLSIDLKNTQSPKSSGTSLNTHPDKTPDSWEDDLTDDAPVEAPGPSLKPVVSNEDPAPPPPTPVSPQEHDLTTRKWDSRTFPEGGKPSPRFVPADKRPEKTTSTANRMIAGALGIKAPKKTDEQRQYDRATKEAEIKRKNREKEQKERERLEDEQAKAAVWDD